MRVVRVKWAGGYHDVSDGEPGPRRTWGYNGGANIETVAAAQAAGEAYLQILAVDTSLSPTLADTDDWPEVGDAVDTIGFDGELATQRIRGRRVDVTLGGHARLTPTLGAPAEEITARHQLALERLAAGLGGGRTAGVAPSEFLRRGVPNGPLRQVNVPEWTWSAFTLDYVFGPIFPVKEAMVVTKATGFLTETVGDDISAQVRLAGSPVATLTIDQGDVTTSRLGSLLCLPGQTLQCALSDLGSLDATDLDGVKLTIQLKAAPAMLRVETT